MSEQQHPASASLPAIQALRQRIEREAPHLHVLDVYEQPHPFVRVKDTLSRSTTKVLQIPFAGTPATTGC